MKRETLKMPVFVYAQSWYKPEACSDCPEFNFVLLPEGAAAFCDHIEDDKQCTMDEELELDLQSSARVALEALSQAD
jgi:hypothetical protein